jgi:hypothetical protein
MEYFYPLSSIPGVLSTKAFTVPFSIFAPLPLLPFLVFFSLPLFDAFSLPFVFTVLLNTLAFAT